LAGRTVTPGIVVYRYPMLETYVTSGDAFDDLLTQIGFLTSCEYVEELLVSAHGVSHRSAARRAHIIVAHARYAIAYIAQARSSAPEVAFLPGYYGILNLMKLCVLFSSRHADLPNHRWHGAQYRVDAKDSRTIVTEEVTLHKGGALALFYEVMCGKPMVSQTVRVGDLFPYIADSAAEWHMASGKPDALAAVHFTVTTSANERRLSATIGTSQGQTAKIADIPALKGFEVNPNNPAIVGVPTAFPLDKMPQNIADECVVRHLIYYPHYEVTTVPVGKRKLQLFEELPIAIAFFHLSSIVRYKPDFVAKVRDSKFWPVLAAIHKGALFRFALLSWSYIRQATVAFERR
jgi:hypothetical protein